MHVPLTLAALATLTLAIVLLRLLWPRLSRRARSTWITCACATFTLTTLCYLAKWSTSSNRLNTAIYWFCIASYEFFIILFTLLPPKWLTSIVAVVLILPILSTSIFLPLTLIFDSSSHTITPLGGRFFSDRTSPGLVSEAELNIYYRPSWAPFLRRRVQGTRYYRSQCDAFAAFATLQPDHKSVLMSCPAAPDQPPGAARSLVVKFH